jgi:hypothetical protein
MFADLFLSVFDGGQADKLPPVYAPLARRRILHFPTGRGGRVINPEQTLPCQTFIQFLCLPQVDRRYPGAIC